MSDQLVLHGAFHKARPLCWARFRRHCPDGAVECDLPHPPLSRELLLVISDLLPNARHLISVNLSGHGPLMGPFVAAEIGRALQKNNRTITHLDLSSNNIGDDGAEALAAAVDANKTLASLHMNLNAIGGRGGTAVLKALCSAPATAVRSAPVVAAKPAALVSVNSAKRNSKEMKDALPEGGLREIQLDGNLISPELLSAIQQQLLLNNLPRLIACGMPATPAPGTLKKGKKGSETHSLRHVDDAVGAPEAHLLVNSLAPEKHRPSPSPAAYLSHPWLTEGHVGALLAEAMAHNMNALTLSACGRFGGSGLGVLVNSILMRPSPLIKLRELRVSGSGVDDLAISPLAAAISSGGLARLHTIALDRNRLTFLVPPTAIGLTNEVAEVAPGSADLLTSSETPSNGVASAHHFGATLGTLSAITDLDLSTNPLDDATCATLIRATLNGQAGHTLRCLNLGATGAADRSATACAETFHENGGCIALRSLCISGAVSDVGATRIASTLSHAFNLQELWLGNCISDVGAEALLAAIVAPASAHHAASRLNLLGLGGEVRSGVIIRNSELGPRTAEMCAEMLPRSSSCLSDLRLTGNSGISGPGCIRLLGGLQASQQKGGSCLLRSLHIDGCGTRRDDVPSLLRALDPVWVLHELKIDSENIDEMSSRASSHEVGTPAGGKSPLKVGGGGGAQRLLTLQQKLAMAKLLEDNKAMGVRRVESWRLSCSLAEVAWVFTSLCAKVSPQVMEAGLEAWDGADCAHFVCNLGLSQYAESFAFNLRGTTLPTLKMAQLAQLGVTAFDHQKAIMEGIRQLIDAFARKQRAQKANEAWSNLLVGGGKKGATNADEPAEIGDEEQAAEAMVVAPPGGPRSKGRSGGGGGVVEPQGGQPSSHGGSGGAGRRARGDAELAAGTLPINLHLPRIARLPQARPTYGNRGISAAAGGMPKPSIVPPCAAAPGGLKEGLTEWNSLARSYGLHLLPEEGKVGSTSQILHDNVVAVLAHAVPPPPEIRYGFAGAEAPPLPRRSHSQMRAMHAQPIGPVTDLSHGVDLSSSPSLPMLSPGRPGTRNWVTFLHAQHP